MSPEKLARFADSWKYFVCPLCREELRLEGTSLRCERGHTYDVARQGYVNLAPGARQSEYYSRESFEHRGQILSAGYYSHIVDAVLSAVGRYCGQIAASIDFAGLRTRSARRTRACGSALERAADARAGDTRRRLRRRILCARRAGGASGCHGARVRHLQGFRAAGGARRRGVRGEVVCGESGRTTGA